MKSTMLLALFSLLAVAGIRAKNIGTVRELPDITSASLPLNQWHTQDGQGQASFGYSYSGQAASNIRDSDGNMAGSWSYVDADGNLVRATYTADERGFLVSSTNEGPAVVPNVQSDPNKVSTTPMIAACNAIGRPDSKFRMVASEETSPNQYPFMVALVRNINGDLENPLYAMGCGASLISPTKILTAAHCVIDFKTNKPRDARLYQVRLGMHKQTRDKNDAEQTRYVSKVHVHEDYDWTSVVNDIAIVTLDSPVEYTDSVQPICLVPKCFDVDGADVIAMGWGDTENGGRNSDVLRHATLTVVNNDKCKVAIVDQNLPDSALCAVGDGQDTCQNDSGGPLIIDDREAVECRYKQVGVVSYGDECAKGIPGVYAKVASFIPWIEERLREE